MRERKKTLLIYFKAVTAIVIRVASIIMTMSYAMHHKAVNYETDIFRHIQYAEITLLGLPSYSENIE